MRRVTLLYNKITSFSWHVIYKTINICSQVCMARKNCNKLSSLCLLIRFSSMTIWTPHQMTLFMIFKGPFIIISLILKQSRVRTEHILKIGSQNAQMLHRTSTVTVQIWEGSGAPVFSPTPHTFQEKPLIYTLQKIIKH